MVGCDLNMLNSGFKVIYHHNTIGDENGLVETQWMSLDDDKIWLKTIFRQTVFPYQRHQTQHMTTMHMDLQKWPTK